METEKAKHHAKKPAKKDQTKRMVAGVVVLLIVAVLTAIVVHWYHKDHAPKPVSQADIARIDRSIYDWNQHNGSNITELVDDFSALSTDAKGQNVSNVGTDCQHIKSDSETAQSAAPIPDDTVNGPFQAGLKLYVQGSQQCITAVKDLNGNELAQAVTTLNQGNDDFLSATSAVSVAISQVSPAKTGAAK
ncbi:MAG TPA: hypothetical protein VGS28_00325 [Candidatus Saccharimonadales bacterium]|nr:hypothetical protein [Candidatus Saccharimonadales bacterium]